MGAIELWIKTYALYLRIALVVIVLGTTAYFSAHWATQIERSSWLAKQAKADADAIAAQQESQRESAHAGAMYELDRAKVHRVVSIPDRKLDALLQTPVGDLVVPGDLGVRLNAIASAADQTSETIGQPDTVLRSADSISHSVGAASGVETAPGEQYRIGDRLPLASQATR